jgi:thiamine-monophosphate kinase
MTSSSSKNRLGEFGLIAQLFAPLATARGAFGLKDDAALMAVRAGEELVITTDAIVEGVHFRSDDPPDTIAQKALRVNLSDLAAKGARPLGYLMALALPAIADMRWLRSFADGLKRDQKQFGVSLLGGDTTSTPGPLTIAITAFGTVRKGRMVHRWGAKPGDLVFVTGTVGDSAGGLAVLRGEGGSLRNAVRDHLVHRFRVPQPRTAFAGLLHSIASAALDVSDGLIADLGHIAEVSKVRIVIEAPAVPRSAALHALWGDGEDGLVRGMISGDDYEIAFTARPGTERKVIAAARKSGVTVSRIGLVEKGRGVAVHDAARKTIAVPKGGWTHF